MPFSFDTQDEIVGQEQNRIANKILHTHLVDNWQHYGTYN